MTGTSDVTFTASDPGAGVYEAVFTVDGKIVQSSVLDEAGGSCRNVGQTSDGLPAFLRLQPCPSSLSADVGFDASSLTPGPHHLIVSVLDAAGNSAPVLDRTITVPATLLPGAPGVTARSGQRRRGEHRSSPQRALAAHPQGSSHNTLRAQRDDHRPPDGPGGRADRRGSDRRHRDRRPGGRGDLRDEGCPNPRQRHASRSVSPGGLSSRTVLLSYTAHAGEPRPAAVKMLQLAVQAPVRMTIAPRTAPSQGTIHFRGRLLAGPFPKGGKPLILEARSGHGGWIEFHVVRTSSRGRFAAAYHFRFPGPARYQFRAVCEQEADYPYAAGSSRAIPVTER